MTDLFKKLMSVLDALLLLSSGSRASPPRGGRPGVPSLGVATGFAATSSALLVPLLVGTDQAVGLVVLRVGILLLGAHAFIWGVVRIRRATLPGSTALALGAFAVFLALAQG